MTTASIMGVAMAFAQNIAVVSEDGNTTIWSTLQEAVENATNGSIIYLSDGGYQISDDVKITKKLSIIGKGYKPKSGNADGRTAILGNLWFNENSGGSSVMGCYISGDVNIGDGNASVNNVVVKYCNLNSVKVKNNTCLGTIVNQNYIRSNSSLSRGTIFMNNVAYYVNSECGTIVNNLFTNGSSFSACYVARNIFLGGQGVDGNSTYCENMAKGDVGDFPVNIGDMEWADLFVKYNNGAISPGSNFDFAEDYKSLYKNYGIYGGTGFIEQPPLPYIEAKSIPEQTDVSGNLNIKIRVNTGE